MPVLDTVYMWVAEIVSLGTALFAFIYGFRRFFKKGVALYLQSITMAMGCHALGSAYHVCQTLTVTSELEGFTPAYLGHIGFFLFFIAASYGQMDRIVDDGSPELRSSRLIALAAPVAAIALYVVCLTAVREVGIKTTLTYLLVWMPACVSLYFNFKHAIIPDLDFGFVKAIKPYNVLATLLGFSELAYLATWNSANKLPMVISAVLFGFLCIATVVTAGRGSKKWTI